MIQLRDYQTAAVDSLFEWFDTSTGNPLVVVPTGGGKSIIIAEFCRRVLTEWPRERILILTHVRELIEQNHKAMLRAWPEAPTGIYSAGLKRRDLDVPILFGGIQSLYQKAEQIGWADLVLIDEVHLVPRKGAGMYRTLLAALRSMNPKVKLIGFTATPFRTGEGSLASGKERLFHGTAYTCDLAGLIAAGWLSNVRAKAPMADGGADIDTRGVHIRGGEFIESELQAAAMVDGKVASACREIAERGADRRSWLVFCCGLDHAEAVATDLATVHGVSVATVFGETDADERDRVVREFREGTIRAVVNVGVLTTGFDAPVVDLIALLRPTMSAVLYVQMVGRGLRVAAGKKDCLVLDFGSNFMRHGPIDCVRIREPDENTKGGDAPMKKCPECDELVPTAKRECPECGYEFPPPETMRHDKAPDETAEFVAGLVHHEPIQRWPVESESSGEWRSQQDGGKPSTLRVTYSCGFNRRVSEWVCFNHQEGSFPRRKACAWWIHRMGRQPFPASVDEASVRMECGELRAVSEVVVYVCGKYPEIRGLTMAREPGQDDAPVSVARRGVDVSYDDIPF